MFKVYLTEGEARDFARFGLLVPPAAVMPKGWAVSRGGLAVPPPPTGVRRKEEITRRWQAMSDKDRARPKFAPDSDYWDYKFYEEHDKACRHYEGFREPKHINSIE